MEPKTFKLLDKIDQYTGKNQLFDHKALKNEGLSKSLAKEAEIKALVGWSGIDFYLTQDGYSFLIQYRISRATTELSEATKKLDASVNEMNKHQVQMNKYTKILISITIALFILTLINVVLAVARL